MSKSSGFFIKGLYYSSTKIFKKSINFKHNKVCIKHKSTNNISLIYYSKLILSKLPILGLAILTLSMLFGNVSLSYFNKIAKFNSLNYGLSIINMPYINVDYISYSY